MTATIDSHKLDKNLFQGEPIAQLHNCTVANRSIDIEMSSSSKTVLRCRANSRLERLTSVLSNSFYLPLTA